LGHHCISDGLPMESRCNSWQSSHLQHGLADSKRTLDSLRRNILFQWGFRSLIFVIQLFRQRSGNDSNRQRHNQFSP